jgi:hypothetical protein
MHISAALSHHYAYQQEADIRIDRISSAWQHHVTMLRIPLSVSIARCNSSDSPSGCIAVGCDTEGDVRDKEKGCGCACARHEVV